MYMMILCFGTVLSTIMEYVHCGRSQMMALG